MILKSFVFYCYFWQVTKISAGFHCFLLFFADYNLMPIFFMLPYTFFRFGRKTSVENGENYGEIFLQTNSENYYCLRFCPG